MGTLLSWHKSAVGWTAGFGRFQLRRNEGRPPFWVVLDRCNVVGTRIHIRNAKKLCESLALAEGVSP
jgi:hypothetical protein